MKQGNRILASIAIAGLLLSIVVASSAQVSVESYFDAVLRQDIGAVEVALKSGVDPNVVDWRGNHALHWAAVLDNAELVKLLARKGARIDPRSQISGATPLHLAIDSNSDRAMEALLQAGADVSALVIVNDNRADKRLTPVDLAARRNRHEIVERLVKSGAQIRVNPSYALDFSVSNDNTALARFLLSGGASHPGMNPGPRTPAFLSSAVRACNAAMVGTLLEHGAHLPYLESTFLEAVRRCRVDVLQLLLSLKPAINGQAEHELPLFAAASRGDVSIVRWLIDNGANPRTRGRVIDRDEGWVPFESFVKARNSLAVAATVDDPAVFDMLLADQRFKFDCDEFGAALIALSDVRKFDPVPRIVRLLELAQCFPKDAPVLHAALLRATGAEHLATMDLLLDAGASLKPRSDSQFSSVIYVPVDPSIPARRMYMNWRSNIPRRLAGYTQVSALDIALATRHYEAVQLLLAVGPDVQEQLGSPLALHRMAQPLNSAGRFERGDASYILRLLLQKGAQVNSRDADGRTPLMIASMNGDVAYADALLKAGADRSLKDLDGADAASLTSGTNGPYMRRLLSNQASASQLMAQMKTSVKFEVADDAIEKAVCLRRNGAEERFGFTRGGVATRHPRLPITPFTGFMAIRVKIDADNTPLPPDVRTMVVNETLRSLAIWRIVCPNCSPWSLSVAHVDKDVYMVEDCYREIRDIPHRKNRSGIPQPGVQYPANTWRDFSASCARRYGSSPRGGEPSEWRYIPVPANDPVRAMACKDPGLREVASVLGCFGDIASSARLPTADVSIGFSTSDIGCKGDRENIIACAKYHKRVDLNTRDFVFDGPSGSDARFGGGKRPVEFRRVMLHEVGHWLGLDHMEGSQNIMSEIASNAICVSNQNVAMLTEPVSQALSLNSESLHALLYE